MRNEKLNRKGFTLVELLAVIVVLAIILVISVPMILNTISNSKQQAFEASLKTVVKYYREQLSLAALGKSESKVVNDNYEYDSETRKLKLLPETQIPKVDAQKIGLSETDYKIENLGCTVSWDTDGNVRVELVPATGGQFEGLGIIRNIEEEFE